MRARRAGSRKLQRGGRLGFCAGRQDDVRQEASLLRRLSRRIVAGLQARNEAQGYVQGTNRGVSQDSLSMTFPDGDQSVEKHRFLIIGARQSGTALVVSRVFCRNAIRVISARPATGTESAL